MPTTKRPALYIKKRVRRMKIKDLAAMVGNCRNIVLINTKDSQGNIVRQHVELNGRAIFPMDGMQPITPETLLTIADVEEEIRDKYTVTQINMNQLIANAVDDLHPEDKPAKMGSINLETRYAKLISVHTDDGKETHFLPAAMLKPIKDARQLNLVIRKHLTSSLIVALDGMAHVATFTPHVAWADSETANELNKVWREVSKLAEENERREQEGN